MGKQVVVTSFDGGPLRPTPAEMEAGWVSHGDLAISPKVVDVDTLNTGGWDEWYVFARVSELRDIEVFVNYGSFTLAGPSEPERVDRTWDKAALASAVAAERDLLSQFWAQLDAVSPESYIADGDVLNVATTDGQLFDRIRSSLKI